VNQSSRLGTDGADRSSDWGKWTVRKFANRLVARAEMSVMVPVFSRAAPKPCSKTMDPMVLTPPGNPIGVSGAKNPPGRLGGSGGVSTGMLG